jgi:hypothetical protein
MEKMNVDEYNEHLNKLQIFFFNILFDFFSIDVFLSEFVFIVLLFLRGMGEGLKALTIFCR